MAALTGLNSLEVRAEVMRLLGDNCDQQITARHLRDALITVFQNAVGTVSPVYMKDLVAQLDEMGMDLLNHSLQVTMEDGAQEIKIFDEDMGMWREVYSEQHIKELIAAASKFEGVVAESGHTQGTGVKQLAELLAMMAGMTEAQMLMMTGHYYTWNGSDGYIIQPTDLNGEIDGAIMQTNDWIQMINSGGTVIDPADPDYATQKPIMHLVHIAGDNLSKVRADGLYSFEPWADGSYEARSLVTFGGKVYRSNVAIVGGDENPLHPTSKWTEIDLSGVANITYFGRGGFEHDAGAHNAANNYGMPAGTHPDPQIRPPLNGDRYVDLLHGAEVDFIVDPTTGDVTITHEFGEKRTFTVDVNATTGQSIALLKGISASTNQILSISIKDKVTSGAVYEMMLADSRGDGNVGLYPIVIYANNSHIEEFNTVYVNSVIDLTAVFIEDFNGTYEIEIEGKAGSDISTIEVDGVTVIAGTSTTVDAQEYYPSAAKRNVITTNNLPAVPASDYKGQVHYDIDSKSGKVMQTAVATVTGSWTPTVIGNTPIGVTKGTQATGIIVLTEDEYEQLAIKHPTTLYFVEEQ